MFSFKKKYFLIIESIKDINLRNLKKCNKFLIIYRSKGQKENINDLLTFRKQCKLKFSQFSYNYRCFWILSGDLPAHLHRLAAGCACRAASTQHLDRGAGEDLDGPGIDGMHFPRFSWKVGEFRLWLFLHDFTRQNRVWALPGGWQRPYELPSDFTKYWKLNNLTPNVNPRYVNWS